MILIVILRMRSKLWAINKKAKIRYNKGTDSWNIFIEVDGRDIVVGTTLSEGYPTFFKTTEFNSKEEAIEWINNSPFELMEE